MGRNHQHRGLYCTTLTKSELTGIGSAEQALYVKEVGEDIPLSQRPLAVVTIVAVIAVISVIVAIICIVLGRVVVVVVASVVFDARLAPSRQQVSRYRLPPASQADSLVVACLIRSITEAFGIVRVGIVAARIDAASIKEIN